MRSPSPARRLHLFYLLIVGVFAALSAYQIGATNSDAGSLPLQMVDVSSAVLN